MAATNITRCCECGRKVKMTWAVANNLSMPMCPSCYNKALDKELNKENYTMGWFSRRISKCEPADD